MKIVSLYKIWQGHEFLVPSIESNYNHVDKMVFVSSDKGWNGESGNTTLPILKEWKQKNDSLDKIVILEFETTNQEEQYEHGIDYIRKNIPDCKWIQLVDSDEVWYDGIWVIAKSFLKINDPKPINCITCDMWTYVKSPLYRMKGNGEVKPVVFIRPTVNSQGARYCYANPKLHLPIFVHHFALVRSSWDVVYKKLQTSIIGDNAPYKLCDIDKWKSEVWDTLPKGKVYHYITGCAKLWAGVRVVNPSELPLSCRNLKFDV